MRPTRKKPKKCVKTKIHKKKLSSKIKKCLISCGNNTPDFATAAPDIETINHALYIDKSQQAEGKGKWKVLPKDSVEVYKDKLRRKNNKRRRKDSQDDSSEDSIPDRGRDKESSGKHVCKCRVRKKRCDTSCSSYSSYTCDSQMSSSETMSN
ncbi:uncharacterized protein LOC120635359 isoform X1 [Pararge aegeria]|uniref:uncharacterized protein LOC120635359 isoform X1 n=1 Tax=Pararge aegeria TaxID=116150 RepID=UPI0019D11B37|nr:uncharacterized protein LOC120635359 isoform X1 [Pararge aegeria]